MVNNNLKQNISNLGRGIKAFSRLCLARARHEYIPWYLFFLITERCNMRCEYCYADIPNRMKDPSRKIKEWSTQEIFRIIDEFYCLGTRYLNIQGGEPLLRQDLEEIIDYANNKGMLTDIFTNGLLIDKQLNALKKLSRITISLEGDEAAHDRDRGKGTYQKIVENMRLLYENNLKFTINYTITRNNADVISLKHVLELAQKYNSLVGTGEAIIRLDPGLADRLVANNKLREFWQEVRQLKLQGYPLQKSLKSIDFCIESLDFVTGKDFYNEGDPLPYDKKIYPCGMGKYCAYLDADGMLYPCANQFGRIGKNIFEFGAKSAWEHVNRHTKCYICRDSISGGVNYFFSLDFNTVMQAARHYFKVYFRAK